MAKPAFLYRENNSNASVTSDSTLTGLDPTDTLFFQKDAFWAPADTDEGHYLSFSGVFATSPSWDAIGLIGEGLDAVRLTVEINDSLVGNMVLNGDFSASVPDSDWNVPSGSAWTFPSSGGAYIDGTQTGVETITQDNADLVNLEYYTIKAVVTDCPSSNGGATVRLGVNGTDFPVISSDGTYRATIQARSIVPGGADAIRLLADSDFVGTFQSIEVSPTNTLSSIYDAAHISEAKGDLPSSQVSNTPKLIFGNISSDFKIFGVVFDTIRDYPAFSRSDYEHVKAEGTINESPSFDFIGSNKLAEKQKLMISWPQINVTSDAAEFANIVAFKDNTLRKLKPFIMIPEIDSDECYFAWFAAGQEFSAPWENKDIAVRRISPLTAWARVG